VSPEQMAADAYRTFVKAAIRLGLVPADGGNVPDGMLINGWESAAFAACRAADGDQNLTLAAFAGVLAAEYLAGAGLPADHPLADPRWGPCWKATAVLLHGLLTADRDERDVVERNVGKYLEGVVG
jgi:hypothetical protein